MDLPSLPKRICRKRIGKFIAFLSEKEKKGNQLF
jgi:hypothetical protein